VLSKTESTSGSRKKTVGHDCIRPTEQDILREMADKNDANKLKEKLFWLYNDLL